jgi:hypothetical protein
VPGLLYRLWQQLRSINIDVGHKSKNGRKLPRASLQEHKGHTDDMLSIKFGEMIKIWATSQVCLLSVEGGGDRKLSTQ